ncbi:MAG: transcriptional regulator, AraC family, partial [Oscillospiraceae bacterium]|nr:transcriptional regulator, AraC family [Oscillospiraceae bacterium]
MSKSDLTFHEPFLLQNGFSRTICNDQYNSEGQCYALDPLKGKGHYWVYTSENMFSIVIHDFVLYEDFFLECEMPEYLSVTYYESISGEELTPYRRLNAGCVKGYFSDCKYQAMIHK